jgi:uncharacterized membrane protein YphA (DoxX/SURF4 family)
MNNQKIIEWVLRVAVAGEFLGHGILAMEGKPAWIKWFSTFGISDVSTAATLLFLVGLLDVLLAVLILVRPVRLALLWMAFWGFFTAVLRPVVGESFWDFIERFANWGAPFALLLLRGWPVALREWFR